MERIISGALDSHPWPVTLAGLFPSGHWRSVCSVSSETLGLLPSPQHPLTTTFPFLYLLFPQEEQSRYSGFSSDSTAYCETLGELLSLSEPQFPHSFKQFLLSTYYVPGCVLGTWDTSKQTKNSALMERAYILVGVTSK